MTAAGALTFARYAFPPNELGYCGPAGARTMLGGRVDEIGHRARQFEGAWVYLQVIADALGLDDPLAEEVVEAYWLGSDLLERVSSADLVALLQQRFAGQVGGTWREASSRASAHHAFQVFEVYPWAAMLKGGLPPGPAVHVLDRCRIRTGRVTDVRDELVTVTTSLLGWDGVHLVTQDPVAEQARWAVDGLSLMPAPHVDDHVALHWDWVCDVLTPVQAERLVSLEVGCLRGIGLRER